MASLVMRIGVPMWEVVCNVVVTRGGSLMVLDFRYVVENVDEFAVRGKISRQGRKKPDREVGLFSMASKMAGVDCCKGCGVRTAS